MSPKRNRVMYQGGFDPAKPQSPVCWSSDGDKPDGDVKSPIAKTCASCPNSVKGSKITPNGKPTTACSFLKRVVVKPIGNLDMEPLLLKIPPTSLWDKENKEAEARGYYAWDQYTDHLRAGGVKHTAAVVTRIKFDPHAEYPKLLFKAFRWLTEEEAREVVPMTESEDTKKLLVGKWVENVEVPTEAEPVTASSAPVVAQTPVAVKTPEPVVAASEWDDDVVTPAAKPTPTAAPAKPTPPAKPVAAKAAAPVVAQAPAPTDALAALAADWD